MQIKHWNLSYNKNKQKTKVSNFLKWLVMNWYVASRRSYWTYHQGNCEWNVCKRQKW